MSKDIIMDIGTHRSGIDSGEIDYGVFIQEFENLSIKSLDKVIKILKELEEKCNERKIKLDKDRNLICLKN